MDSKYLDYVSNGDGTCSVFGVLHNKKDLAKGDLYIPRISPEGELVTGICDYAFSGCTGLHTVYLPDTIESIGEWAFRDCSGLKNISIQDGMRTIGEGSFYGCVKLTTITIPASVKRIGERAFADAEEVYACVKRKPLRWRYNFTYAQVHWAK